MQNRTIEGGQKKQNLGFVEMPSEKDILRWMHYLMQKT